MMERPTEMDGMPTAFDVPDDWTTCVDTIVQTEEWKWQENAFRTQEIIPGLFLGAYYSSASPQAKEELFQLNPTHIVCVRSREESAVITPNYPAHFRYLVVEVNGSESIISSVKRVIDFLADCFNAGGRALVHGNGGLNRSAAMVIGYIIWCRGVNVGEAFKTVQEKRFSISVDSDYLSQLSYFEMTLQSMRSVPQNCNRGSKKRGREDDDEVDQHYVKYLKEEEQGTTEDMEFA